jgi:hypothetical protein
MQRERDRHVESSVELLLSNPDKILLYFSGFTFRSFHHFVDRLVQRVVLQASRKIKSDSLPKVIAWRRLSLFHVRRCSATDNSSLARCHLVFPVVSLQIENYFVAVLLVQSDRSYFGRAVSQLWSVKLQARRMTAYKPSAWKLEMAKKQSEQVRLERVRATAGVGNLTAASCGGTIGLCAKALYASRRTTGQGSSSSVRAKP